MAASRAKTVEERVEAASRERFADRPTYKIGDHVPVEMIEGIWRNKGRTIIDTSSDVADADAPILPAGYDVSQSGMVWYILFLSPTGNSASRARIHMGRRGYQLYWPREVVAVIRGRGDDRRFEQKVRPLFPGYALLHASRNVAPEDVVEKHEAWANGISGFVTFDRIPVTVANAVVERVVEREREGEFIHVERRSAKVIPSLDWLIVGGLAIITGGPLRSFTGVIEEIDFGRQVAKIAVAIFGRATLVELDFADLRQPA